MKTQDIAAAEIPCSDQEIEKWETLLETSCDAVARTSPSLTKSIIVTGRLARTGGEAWLIMMLSKRLAAERGLRVTYKLQGRDFAVQFSRNGGVSDGTPRQR